MSSRSKKKRLWREEKERRYQVEKEFYDRVLDYLEDMKKDYAEGKYKDKIADTGKLCANKEEMETVMAIRTLENAKNIDLKEKYKKYIE